jgi:L-serine deaminase
MSSDENGPSRVAALGFRTFVFFAWPTNGDVFFGKAAALAAAMGLMGVAGASCGGAATAELNEGTVEVRFPMLRIAGSTNGAAGVG